MRMTLPAGLWLMVALAGCDHQPPAARVAPAPPRSPLDAIPDAPAPPITIKPSFQCAKPVVEGEPILPLDAPLSELQKLICAEPELALLDRQTHEAYLATRLRSGVDRARLAKAQQQWETDRGTCLKAADPRDCVAEASRTRLAELALQDPTTMARTQLEFSCKGTATPLTAAFYSGLKPAFAVLGFGRQQAIVFVEPSNAGLKYGRTGVDFFVRQGQVKAEFYGRTLACTSPTWRPSEDAPTMVAAQATDALVEQVGTPAPASPSASLVSAPPPSSTSAGPSEVTTTAPAVQTPLTQAAPRAPTSPTTAPLPASVQARTGATAAPVADTAARQVASPAPTLPVPVRPPASASAPAKDPAVQATDALARQTASHEPKPPAPVRPSAAAGAPTRSTAAQAADVLVGQAVSQAPTSPAPAPPSATTSAAPAKDAAAQAADALVRRVVPQAPISPGPMRPSNAIKPQVRMAAAQATDALVRAVVMQAQAPSAPARTEAPTEAVPPSPAEAKP